MSREHFFITPFTAGRIKTRATDLHVRSTFARAGEPDAHQIAAWQSRD